MREVRLPELSGRSHALYRVLTPVLLLIGLVLVVLSYRGEVDAQANARGFYALDLINTRYTSRGAMVIGFHGPMKQALAGEEVLLAVDGHPIPSDYNAQTRAMAGAEGAAVRLDLAREDGTRHIAVVRRTGRYLVDAYAGSGFTFASRHWLQYACLQLALLLSVGTALLLYLRRPRDPVAALLGVGLACHAIADNLATVWTDTPPLLLALLGAAAGVGMYSAVLFFPDARVRGRWAWPVLSLIALCNAVSGAAFWIDALTTTSQWLGNILALVLAAAVIARYRATAAGVERQQMKFAMLGFVVALALTIVANLFGAIYPQAPSARAQVWIIAASNVSYALASVALLSGLLVSLLRYRLYDADTVISRSAAYAVLTLLLGAAFAASEKIIEVVGEEWFGEGSKALAAGAGAAIAATLIAPLHGRIHHFAEARFQRALAAVRSLLPQRVADMREYAALDELTQTVLAQLEAGVRATRAAVLLADREGAPVLARVDGIDQGRARDWVAAWTPDERRLTCERADLLFPLRLRLQADGTDTVGWIVLGPRPDGTFYSRDEREAIAALADPVARAIHVVRRRTEQDAALRARIERLEQEIAGLRSPAQVPGAALA